MCLDAQTFLVAIALITLVVLIIDVILRNRK